MATKFIGFKHKKGSFTNEKTGELVQYDNYSLYFITGNVPDIVGYYPSKYVVKGDVICQVLGFDGKYTDEVISEHLHDLLNKEVLTVIVDIDNKPVLTSVIKSPEVVPPKVNK